MAITTFIPKQFGKPRAFPVPGWVFDHYTLPKVGRCFGIFGFRKPPDHCHGPFVLEKLGIAGGCENEPAAQLFVSGDDDLGFELFDYGTPICYSCSLLIFKEPLWELACAAQVCGVWVHKDGLDYHDRPYTEKDLVGKKLYCQHPFGCDKPHSFVEPYSKRKVCLKHALEGVMKTEHLGESFRKAATDISDPNWDWAYGASRAFPHLFPSVKECVDTLRPYLPPTRSIEQVGEELLTDPTTLAFLYPEYRELQTLSAVAYLGESRVLGRIRALQETLVSKGVLSPDILNYKEI